MKTRIISALVALPILIIFLVLGGLPMKIALTAVAMIGLYELYKALCGYIKPVHLSDLERDLYIFFFVEMIIKSASLFCIFITLFMLAILFYVVLTMKAEIQWMGSLRFLDFSMYAS